MQNPKSKTGLINFFSGIKNTRVRRTREHKVIDPKHQITTRPKNGSSESRERNEAMLSQEVIF